MPTHETEIKPMAVVSGKKGGAEPLFQKLHHGVDLARKQGFRVDGVKLAEAVLNEETTRKMEQLIFNEKSLGALRKKVTRIEFIVDGPLPPDLTEEPPLKKEALFRQHIGYAVCKACQLCIQVCPKHVYKDDGFGRPDKIVRRDEECTGPQCRLCVDTCPENTIQLVMAEPVFKSSLFVLLPNPFAFLGSEKAGKGDDFFVGNPLKTGEPAVIKEKLNPEKLSDCHPILGAAFLQFLLETKGYSRQFIDSKNPEGDLRIWARENGRDKLKVLEAVRFLYGELPQITSLKRGKYDLGRIINRVIDEIIYSGESRTKKNDRALLTDILSLAHGDETYLGAKNRPIGGLLPAGTSVAWKTPYGEEIPEYTQIEKCLGPECGLCVTQCPEGGGGDNSAVRMVLKVPQGTIPSLVRGLEVHLLRFDGTHSGREDIENLTGVSPFVFEVEPDYCKSCGICITCCPHGVISPAARVFDLKTSLP